MSNRLALLALALFLSAGVAHAASELSGMQPNLPEGFTFDSEGDPEFRLKDWKVNTVDEPNYFLSGPRLKHRAVVQLAHPASDRVNVTSLADNKLPFYAAMKGERVESATQCDFDQGLCVTHTPKSCEHFRKAIGARDDEELRQKISAGVVADMTLAFSSLPALTKLAVDSMTALNSNPKTQILNEDFSKLKEYAFDTKNAAANVAALNMSGNLCLHIGSVPPSGKRHNPGTGGGH